MAMKNKYAKRARISEAKIREIVRYVAHAPACCGGAVVLRCGTPVTRQRAFIPE